MTRTGRAGRSGAHPVRVLTALVVVALATLVTVPAAPGGAQEDVPDEVSLRGLDLSTWVGPQGTWVFDVAVEGAPGGASIGAAVYEALPDRGAFDAALFGVAEGDRLATIPAVELEPAVAAPGGGTAARLSLTLDSDAPTVDGHRHLERDLEPGVYPVEVEVSDEEGEVLGRQVVFLTRVAGFEADTPPMLVAPVLPVGGPPSVDAGGGARLDPSTTADVADVANGLTITDDLPATLAPRPETLEALARDPAGTEALDALRAASASRQVLDGPYVDVPLDAWVARGMQAELTRQRERGNTILSDRLGRVDSSTWLARDGLTPEAAAELWSVGVRTVVLGPGTTAGDTGTGPATIPAGAPRTLEALTADAGLSRALDRSLLDGGPRDAEVDDNGLAAELAVIAGGSDDEAGVVLLPPEGWPSDATDVGRLGAVLQDPLSPVRTVTTTELLDSLPGRGAVDLVPRPPPDLGDYPQSLALARSRLSSYTSLVGSLDDEVVALDQRLLLSGARTFDGPERQAYVDSVLTTVDERLGGVVAPTEQSITLTARDADIPLTLRNRLDVPVTVLIELAADSRVEFRGEGGGRITRELAPGDQEIRIPIHTRVPGDAPIDITILTPDGVVALDQVEYTVRSTAISGIGVILSAGAATFLLVWWARHWTRARRARSAPATTEEGGA